MVTFLMIPALSLVLLLQILSCQGLLEPIGYPPTLKQCYEFKTSGVNVTQIPAKDIQDICIKNYLYSIADSLWAPKITQEGWNYISSLFRKLRQDIQESQSSSKSKRHKRQAPRRPFRFRQEIRTLTPGQWRRVVRAFRELKRLRVDQEGNNAYDVLSFLHSGSVLSQAHGGANFPGWHRWYLLILETALGVPCPYWDSTLDFYLDDPTTSLLWTDEYLGNGDGDVTTGPFRDWQTILRTPLVRNIAAVDSSLMTHEGINFILSRRRLVEIVEPLEGMQGVYSLEGHHNGPHNWVGGYLSRAQSAAWDPIFFFHHAFIDAILEMFRQRQMANGIDPARDYPVNVPPGHEWYNVTNFLPFYGMVRNIEGLSHELSNLVRYAPLPVCANRCGNTPLIRCDRARQRCVTASSPSLASAATSGFSGAAGFAAPGAVPASSGVKTISRAAAESRGALPVGPRFRSSPFTDMRARNPQLLGAQAAPVVAFSGDATRQRAASAVIRKKRSVKPVKSIILKNDTFVVKKTKATTSSLERPFQNTFMIDGVSDINLWVFVPVPILYERPVDTSFNSHLFRNGQTVNDTDMYDPSQYDILKDKIKSKKLATSPKCKVSGSGASKVFVSTDGLNYLGQYTDYAIVDERHPVSSIMTYVGIKKPNRGSADVLFTAFDSCSRACRATCLVPKSNPPVYKPCSGAFRITSSEPKMYSPSYGDAVESLWHLSNGIVGDFDGGNGNSPPVSFICDFKDKWPWQIDTN